MGTVNHAVGMVGIGACSSFQKITEGPLLMEKVFKVCKSFRQIKYKIYLINKKLFIHNNIKYKDKCCFHLFPQK